MEERQSLIQKQYDDGGFCNPNNKPFRYLMLFVISLICFGNYFAYDEIEPLQKILEQDLKINDADYGLFYSLYSFPNMILVFFGGVLGDKIGLRMAALIYSTLVTIGAVLVALGPSLLGHITPRSAYIVMCVGRIIFGMGAESLNVIQTSMVVVWFAGGTELAMALGFVLSMSRLGDFLALSLGGQIATWAGDYRVTLWIGAILCGVSLVSIIVYSALDKYAETRVKDRKPLDPSENEVNFKAVLQFEARFWIVCLLCLAYYSGVLPFVGLLNKFLQTKYNVSPTMAGWYASIVTLSSMILSPFLGKFLDMVGKRPYFVFFGSLVVIPAHLLLAFTNITPLVSIIIIGLSFSLVPGALWPSVPLLINKSEIATAYGVMTAIQNFGLTLINYLPNMIVDQAGYKWGMTFFAGVDAIGLLTALLLIFVDAARGNTLSSVASKKKSDELIN